eukprot:COSAG01_NODE_3283_length_6310_cov_8.652391_2_plen_76_part_00
MLHAACWAMLLYEYRYCIEQMGSAGPQLAPGARAPAHWRRSSRVVVRTGRRSPRKLTPPCLRAAMGRRRLPHTQR